MLAYVQSGVARLRQSAFTSAQILAVIEDTVRVRRNIHSGEPGGSQKVSTKDGSVRECSFNVIVYGVLHTQPKRPFPPA